MRYNTVLGALSECVSIILTIALVHMATVKLLTMEAEASAVLATFTSPVLKKQRWRRRSSPRTTARILPPERCSTLWSQCLPLAFCSDPKCTWGTRRHTLLQHKTHTQSCALKLHCTLGNCTVTMETRPVSIKKSLLGQLHDEHSVWCCNLSQRRAQLVHAALTASTGRERKAWKWNVASSYIRWLSGELSQILLQVTLQCSHAAWRKIWIIYQEK